MQSSIWKLVTAVGIIGIGTLVVLEVQHRLPPQGVTQGNPGEDTGMVVSGAGAPGEENEITPAADSEFDRLFADNSESSAGREAMDSAGGVPELQEPPAASGASAISGAGFEGTASGSGAPNPDAADDLTAMSAPVDKEVRKASLTEDANPFGADFPIPSAADSSADAPRGGTAIQNVGFQSGGSPFPEESPTAGSASPTTDNGGATAEPAKSPFAQEDPPGGAQPSAATGTEPANESNDAGAPAGNGLMFFGGADESGQPGTAASPAASTPAAASSGGAPVSAQANDEIPAFNFGGEPGSPFPTETDTPGSTPADAPTNNEPADNSPPTLPELGGTGSSSAFENESAPASNENPGSSVAPFEREDPTSDFPPVDAPAERENTQPSIPASEKENPFFPTDETPAPSPTQPEREPAPAPRSGRPPVVSPESRRNGGGGRSAEPDVETPTAPADGTFEGGTLPFVDDSNTPRNRPETDPPNDRNPRNPASDPLNGDADFPALPGIEVPEPRDPQGDSGIDPFPPGDGLPNNDGTPSNGPTRPGTGNGGRPGTAPVTSPGGTESEIMRPHLTVQKKAPQTASVGVPLDYVIVVSNEGESSAIDVVVEDELSRGVDLQSTAPVADYDRNSRIMTWRFEELGPRESREIKVRVVPTGEGTLDGVATVRFKAQVKASTIITAPKLSIELTGPAEVRAGDQVSFRYVVRNDGTGDARGVILRSVLPENLRHPEGSDLEYEIEVLAANDEQEITLTAVAAEKGECIATAEIVSAGMQPVTTEARLNIIGELLKVERLGPERRFVGRAAQFQNIITNVTNFEATNVVVIERVPDGMKFISASESAEYNPADRLITWRIDRIEPNEQALLDVELTPEKSGSMDSIVQVVESAGFRTQAVKTVAVEDLHNIGADISHLDGPVAIGERFTFAITIDNRGTAVATNVQLAVQLPKQLKVLAAGSKEQGIEGRPAAGNMVIFKPIAEVAPNSSKTFQLILQGQEPVRNGVVKAELTYREMTESLIVSESVTVFSDAP